MRKAWLISVLLLTCCSAEKSHESAGEPSKPDDREPSEPSDEEPPEPTEPATRIIETLRECEVFGEGTFNVAFHAEADRCEFRCFEAASCDELRRAFCDEFSGAPRYVQCLQRCGAGRPFSCEDGSNDDALHCDAFQDCADGEDEQDCDDDAFFQCDDGGHARLEYRCDGESDCFDASDEEDCPADAVFACQDGLGRVPTAFRCDAEDDCRDGSDEADCPADRFFVCDGGARVPKEWVCDGAPDCLDASDEQQDCALLQCR